MQLPLASGIADQATSRTSLLALAVLVAAALPAAPLRADPAGSSTRLQSAVDNPAPAVFGQELSFIARVAGMGGGKPTGKVTFKAGSTRLGVRSLKTRGIGSAIAGGEGQTCALTAAGGIKCWGRNQNGQLGDGDGGADKLTPVGVVGFDSGIAAVTTGQLHTCALTDAGGAACWGANFHGQLGNGNAPTGSDIPVGVSGLGSGVIAVSAGLSHACALTKAGAVKCWGRNTEGQLGNDDAGNDSDTPVDVVGLDAGVIAISAGGFHTCALTTAGAVKCWGSNAQGQLGNNDAGNDSDTPIDVIGLDGGVAAVAAGFYHTCAVTDDGGAKCWGNNGDGQLGVGNHGGGTNRDTPADVDDLDTGVAAIAPGLYHTCALTTAGGVKCWGLEFYGQLGNGAHGVANHVDSPGDVNGLGSGVAAIESGDNHTCAVTDAGGLKCWGRNQNGQLGDGNSGDVSNLDAPNQVTGFGDGTALVFGEARVTTAEIPAGKNKLIAGYGGDAGHDGSGSPILVQTVLKGGTATDLSVSATAPTVGTLVRMTATVNKVAPAQGVPNGEVRFYDRKTRLATVLLENGRARLKTRKLARGKHRIRAKFASSPNWRPSNSTTTIVKVK